METLEISLSNRSSRNRKMINVRKNIALYKIFTIFCEPLFYGPILVASMQQLGKMTLYDIYIMEAAVIFLCVILNVPAGALADIIGKKKSLIIGRSFLLMSIISFAAASSPLGIWIGNILWAIGYSFQSGADSAMLDGTLRNARLISKFTKVHGCAAGSRLMALAFCALAVGPLAEIDMRIPLLLCIPFSAIPLIAAFFFEEPAAGGIAVTRRYSIREQIDTIKKGVTYAWKKPEIRWMVGFTALLMGASKIWFFGYNPYFETVEISLKYYGLIFFLLNLASWFSSHYAYRIERCISERTCIIFMIASVGLPALVMGAFPYWPMAYLVITQCIVRGFMRPFVDSFMNRHTASEDVRVTALSVRSSLTDLISVLSLAWFGFMDKSLGIASSLAVLGIAVLVLGKISYGRYKKLFP